MEGKKKTMSLEKADAKFPFLALVRGHLNGNLQGTTTREHLLEQMLLSPCLKQVLPAPSAKRESCRPSPFFLFLLLHSLFFSLMALQSLWKTLLLITHQS